MLLRSVQNILTYDKQDLEVVVCDNCSTDGTWDKFTLPMKGESKDSD